MRKLILLCLTVTLFISCSNENTETAEFSYGEDFTFANYSASNEGNRFVLPFIEVILEIGRKSRNCLGIGICRGQVCVPSCGNRSAQEVASAVYYDSFDENQTINMGYVILPFENVPPSPGSLTFYVDEIILAGSDDNYSYTFVQGSYVFDSSIGNYGGYIIPVKIQDI